MHGRRVPDPVRRPCCRVFQVLGDVWAYVGGFGPPEGSGDPPGPPRTPSDPPGPPVGPGPPARARPKRPSEIATQMGPGGGAGACTPAPGPGAPGLGPEPRARAPGPGPGPPAKFPKFCHQLKLVARK